MTSPQIIVIWGDFLCMRGIIRGENGSRNSKSEGVVILDDPKILLAMIDLSHKTFQSFQPIAFECLKASKTFLFLKYPFLNKNVFEGNRFFGNERTMSI